MQIYLEGDKGQVFRIRQKYLTFLLYHPTTLCYTAHTLHTAGRSILILFPTTHNGSGGCWESEITTDSQSVRMSE